MEELTPISTILRRQWRWVIAPAVLLSAAAIIYTATVRPRYEATATIVFPVRTPGLLGAVGIADNASLAAALTGGPTPIKVFGGFLQSERTLNYVSEKSGIAKKDLRPMRTIIDAVQQSTISISARNPDPEVAKKLVNLHLEALREITKEASDPVFMDDVRVLESKLAQQRALLKASEEGLAEFQRQARTAPSLAPGASDGRMMAVPGDFQSRLKQAEVQLAGVESSLAAVREKAGEAAADPELPNELPGTQKWREELAKLQVEYEVKSLSLGPQSDELADLRKNIAAAKEALASTVRKGVQAVESGVLDPGRRTSETVGLYVEREGIRAQVDALKKLSQSAPAEAVELLRRAREVAIRSGLVQQLTGQLEVAKLQAERDPGRWHLLDPAEVDPEPVNKSYARNGAIGILGGLFVGALLALLVDSRRRPREG
jgi:uncharacterized protein involved in exopolysaccharide biosynthesis